MSDFGLKWAKGNTDVSSADIKNLLMHSSYPMLKFQDIGTGTITYTHDGAETDELVVTHDLTYEPLFILLTQWFDIDSDTKKTDYRKAPFIDTLSGGSIYFDSRPYVNTTQLRYSVNSFTGSGTESVSLKYVYAIYYDPDEDV